MSERVALSTEARYAAFIRMSFACASATGAYVCTSMEIGSTFCESATGERLVNHKPNGTSFRPG